MRSLLGACWECREGNNVQSHGDVKFGRAGAWRCCGNKAKEAGRGQIDPSPGIQVPCPPTGTAEPLIQKCSQVLLWPVLGLVPQGACSLSWGMAPHLGLHLYLLEPPGHSLPGPCSSHLIIPTIHTATYLLHAQAS